MDFEDEDKPKDVSKTRRFAPGRALKPKPEPTPVHPSQTDAPSESVSKKTTLIEEEEEDVVVREIDVFYNPSIGANTELYVLQYSLRPSWRAYEMDERCQEVRVNPSTSEVELDLSMDTLTTTWKPPPKLDYAIGVLSGDKLHLNPVHAVPQLRPSMKYLSSKRKQAEAPEESARTSKKQNWVSLEYHGLESEYHSRYLTKMMASENSTIDFNMSRYMLSSFSLLETISVCFLYVFLYLIVGTLISTHCAVGKAAETPEGFTLSSLSSVFYMFITKVSFKVSDSLRCLRR
ncbi:hypothetical protein HID58_049445 [Brassica napus]|uniref:DNA-directed RNA polymerase III subunit RPC5 n=1 Tax=Brassica napus TaxID=3708 RepID=A0ABQ8B526_BRANA|nr:hypothetical protein HID58_049445 [Brassica napus]